MECLERDELATLRVNWAVEGVSTAPTAATLTINPPVGAAIVVPLVGLVHDGDGRYHYVQAGTVDGAWPYRFDAGPGGTVVGGESGLFLVGVCAYDGPFEPWCTWEEVLRQPILAGLLSDPALENFDVRDAEMLIDAASEVLWNLSDRAYPGYKLITRSLCARCWSCGVRWWVGSMYYAGSCDCPPYYRLPLATRYPVVAVTEVQIDSAVLDPTLWRLERNDLVRLDGEPWPSNTDLTDPTDFQCSFVTGVPVPAGGRLAAASMVASDVAAGVMACRTGSDRVTSISAEGVTYQLADPSALIRDASTGNRYADRWLTSIREGRKGHAGIIDPGSARQRAVVRRI